MKFPHFFFFIVKAFTIITITSCGKESITGKQREELAALYEQKKEELYEKTKDNKGGWPADNECDGALWAGIARAAGAEWVQIELAIRSDGRPTRKPNFDCAIPEESATTTSNDMITGIILGLLSAGNKEKMLSLYRYGEKNAWIMGWPEGYLSRVLLRPNGITLLARSLYKLSDGEIDYLVRHFPLVYGPVAADFEGHLILLSRLIASKVDSGYDADIIEKLLEIRNDRDGLAAVMSKDYKKGASLLLGDYKSPSYVRGHENYHLVHWLLVAKLILDNN